MQERQQRKTVGEHSSSGTFASRPLSFYIAIVLALATVVLAAAFFLGAFNGDDESSRDPNAALGQLEGKTPEQIQAELDRIVEEGMFNISIASAVEFEDGTSEGDIRIENSPSNRYLMKVEITRDDTGEVVFSTGMIEPNHHIQRAKLSVDLDAGTYPCTAVFYAHDAESEKLIGQAAAQMTISVLN